MGELPPRPGAFWRISVRTLILLVLAIAATLAAVRAREQLSPAGRWKRDLQSDDLSVRLAAAALIFNVNPPDPGTVLAGLVETLRDPDPLVRAQAASSLVMPAIELSRLGGAPAALALIERTWRELVLRIDDPEASVRSSAIGSLATLARMLSREDEVAPRLIAALKDRDGNVRVMAALSLRGDPSKPTAIQPRAPETRAAWLLALDDEDRLVRSTALDGLAVFGAEEAICRKIIRRLEDPEDIVRRGAGYALQRIDQIPPGVAPDLLGVLERHNKRPAVSRGSGPPSIISGAVLVGGSGVHSGTVDQSNPSYPPAPVLDYAAAALSRIGPAALGMLPALGNLLEDAHAQRDDRRTVAVAEAICGIAPESAEAARAVEVLVEMLQKCVVSLSLVPTPSVSKDSVANFEEELTYLLARYGIHAAPALPALRHLEARAGHEFERQSIRAAIDAIENPPVVTSP